MAPRVETVGLTEIAAVFGVDTDTIGNWRDQGMPFRMASNRPRFKVGQCVQWRREQDRAEQKKRDSSAEGIDASLKRKAAADADLAELKRDKLRGELVGRAESRGEKEVLCQHVRVRVLAIRGRWAPKIIGLGTMQEATAALDALAEDILAALREPIEDSDEDEEAA